MTSTLSSSPTIQIARSTFLEALQAVNLAVGAAKTLPVLGSVLVEPIPGGLRLTTTDLDRTVIRKVPADIDDDIRPFLVSAKSLLSIVGSMPAVPTRIAVTRNGEASSLRIVGGRTSFGLQGMNVTEFPLRHVQPLEGRTADLPTARLLVAMSRAVGHAFDGESRPTITGVCVTGAKTGMTVAATDGHAGYRERISSEKAPIDGEWIIPTSTVAIIPKLFGKAETMRVTTDATSIAFSDDTTTLTSRLIAGPFPNVEQVFAAGRNAKKFGFIVDRGLLTLALKRMTGLGKVPVVRLTFSDTECIVSARDEDGQHAEDAIPSSLESGKIKEDDPFTIVFAPDLFIASLASVGSAEVRLDMSTAERAAIVVDPKNTDGFTGAIVMPRRELFPDKKKKGAAA